MVLREHSSPVAATGAGRRRIAILMAEDDPDDRRLAQEAFAESRLINHLHFVEDGEELLAYLRRQPPYGDDLTYPMPSLILLDLNMPRLDGREALAEIKADPALRHIPVVVLPLPRRRRMCCAPTTSGPAPTSPSRSRSRA